ncbi:hypothetical protein FACS189499_01520 [Clostridia bacterium]|nr:hypothetical protein FACS189499_01520 [Clostridia bacterium]
MLNMPENNRNLDNGSGKMGVSDKAIVRIAEITAAEVDGVSITDKSGIKRLSVSGYRAPVKFRVYSETVEIDISVIVKPGKKAVTVAESIQQQVKTAIQSMTGVAVTKVNVKIVAIER